MLDRKVAIKMPLIDDPRHRQQYIDEARKAVKLDHPGIVPIYQVGKTSRNEPFVVQKLIEGTTLRNILQANSGKLTLSDTVAMMRQVCLAVDAAHSAGIVHRDLKPENLLVEPDGRLYVADFGLAILEDDDTGVKKQEVAGTPLYMSPEQFLGRTEWLDGRSDIWALGVILYELLTGKPPFLGKSLSELKEQIRHHEPEPIHQRAPEIPAGFDAVFRKCCAKKVSDRYGSMRELLKALSTLCESLPFVETSPWSAGGMLDGFNTATTRPGTTTQTVGGTARSDPMKPATSTGRYHPSWGITASMVAVVGLLLAGVLYLQKNPNQQSVLQTPSIENGSTKNGDLSKGAIPGPTSPNPSDTLPKISRSKEVKGPPVKPFCVSVDGSGTHDSISQAVADSAADETITILAGTYRESLKIDRSITLRGDGLVNLISSDANCLTVQGDSRVVVENVHLNSQSATGHVAEVVTGRLQLNRSALVSSGSRSADCVLVHHNAEIEADHCEFQATDHALIHAENDATIIVRASKFSFPSTREVGGQRCGIQATGAAGIVEDCHFTGPCLVGIDWKNCSTQQLKIERCRFENCKTGISAEACNAIVVRGSPEQPVEIIEAIIGMMLVRSKVELNNVVIEGMNGKSKVGLQLADQAFVDCSAADLRAFPCGALVEASTLKATRLGTRDTSFVGVLSVNGIIDAESVHVERAKGFGMAVLGGSDPFNLGTLIVEAVDTDKMTPALYVMSGRVHLGEVVGKQSLCSILVDPDRSIIEDFGLPRKSLIGDFVKLPRRTDATPPNIEVDRIETVDCSASVVFNGIGSCRWGSLEGNLEKEKRPPLVLQPDKLSLDGSEDKGFVVRNRLKR